MRKLLIKVGLLRETLRPSDAFVSWENCLRQLDIDADIVFLGDSITRNGDFRRYFPEYRVCNLGCAGDSIINMAERISAVQAVHPKFVFVMGGVNTLACRTLQQAEMHYRLLLSSLANKLPDSNIFILSVLPVSSDSSYCSNRKIRQFNLIIQQLSAEYCFEYINLYALYSEHNHLPRKYTQDGLHLTNTSYDIWANAIRPYVEMHTDH